ncbi:uncharacterized protein LOC114364326 [Ostrinia furnacalis]|uniref:uncharacterized protein LOC114364326 n=1 Tax=Ostrinia furnacalis TaxID=93504 RepID=UPI001038862D|nr:uncharacterized protein LOC114364326 [Ostrinia furnacalis]
MFYDKDLMNSKSLGKVWRAAHDFKEESDEQASMASICDKLDLWVDSDHEDASRRLSLRTSSIFVDGAARLYKRKIESLFEDTQRLDRDMSKRRRYRCSIDSNQDMSQTYTDPEFHGTIVSDVSEMESGSHGFDESIPSIEQRRKNPQFEDGLNFPSTEEPTKFDKEVQTTPKRQRNRKSNSQELPFDGSFDRNLPFGFILVHDNYQTRIPSKIIFTSITSDINKLV